MYLVPGTVATRLNNSLMKYCVCMYVVCYSINNIVFVKITLLWTPKEKIYMCVIPGIM